MMTPKALAQLRRDYAQAGLGHMTVDIYRKQFFPTFLAMM